MRPFETKNSLFWPLNLYFVLMAKKLKVTSIQAAKANAAYLRQKGLYFNYELQTRTSEPAHELQARTSRGYKQQKSGSTEPYFLFDFLKNIFFIYRYPRLCPFAIN